MSFLPACLLACAPACLQGCHSVTLAFGLSIGMDACLPPCLPVWLVTCLVTCLSPRQSPVSAVCRVACPTAWPSICPTVCRPSACNSYSPSGAQAAATQRAKTWTKKKSACVSFSSHAAPRRSREETKEPKLTHAPEAADRNMSKRSGRPATGSAPYVGASTGQAGGKTLVRIHVFPQDVLQDTTNPIQDVIADGCRSSFAHKMLKRT